MFEDTRTRKSNDSQHKEERKNRDQQNNTQKTKHREIQTH